MKTFTVPGTKRGRSIRLCFLLLFLSATWGFANEQSSEELRGGEAFTDPSYVQEMPRGWEKQRIKYDSSVGEADLVIALDQNMYDALLPLIKKYEKEHNLKIAASQGTCGISAGVLSRKAADIAGFCCPPSLTDRLPGLEFHTLGINAVALLVNNTNTIDNLTISQARRIFTGEIFRWSELKTATGEKGMDLSIQPVGRLHCKRRPGHWRLLLDKEDLFSLQLQEVGAIPDMITAIANNSRAIGHGTFWNVSRYNQTENVKALRIDGYSHNNAENLISGKYPLSRAYSLTTWAGEGVEKELARDLVKYLLQHVDEIDKIHGFAPFFRLKEAGWKFKGDELIGEPQ